MMRIVLSVFFAAMLLVRSAHAQTVLYSLCNSETQASRRIRFPNGALGASTKDKLAMLRGCRKNEIYGVQIRDHKTTLLFSDERLDVEINPTGPILGTDRAYGIGILREWRTAPVPGAYSEPPALYEISLDGSNRVRRLFEPDPNHGLGILQNARGTRVAMAGFTGERYMVSVYDVPAWKLLRTWDFSKVIEAHCPDCSLTTWGWMGDGTRLFFNIAVTGDDEDSRDKPGTYLVVAEHGTDLGKIPPMPGHFEDGGSIHPNLADGSIIAQTPDGDYIFEHYIMARQPRAASQTFLVVSGPRQHKALLQKSRASSFVLSSSGRYLAYVEERQLPTYQTERHLWAYDLQKGDHEELFIVPPPRPPTSTEPNVTLKVLGWSHDQ